VLLTYGRKHTVLVLKATIPENTLKFQNSQMERICDADEWC